MGIVNITRKILDEANTAAEATIKNSELNSQKIIEEAKQKAEAIIKKEAQQSEIDAEALKNRKISAAELQRRKMILTTKQQGIKKVFSTALNNLKDMPEEKYLDFLSEEILKIPNCSGTIILNAKDRENIGEKLIKLVNEKLKGQKLTLSDKTINSSGGFVLKSGDIEINSSFDTILDSIKDELTNDVANALFN